MIISIESGGTTTKLGTKPVFDFTSATTVDAITGSTISAGFTTDELPGRATITPSLTVALPKDMQHVKSINGVSPNEYGEFFIDGSGCDSWDIEEDGISLVDLCPSCTTCENVYRLKYEVENLKMWINTLKDVNLYLSLDSNDDVAERAALLANFRVTDASEDNICNDGLMVDDDYLRLRGTQLLQQYITTVHMWNYIVSRNNSSTIITTAPEDATGFVVQTKRAFTSCSNQQSISCTIEVHPLGVFYDGADGRHGDVPSPMPSATDYPISIFIPAASNQVLFEPLLKNQQQLALGDSLPENGATISNVSEQPYYKRATTGTIPVKVAGTYVVSIKFLPFVYYRAWRTVEDPVTHQISEQDINIRGGNAESQKVLPSIDPDTHDIIYSFNISGCTSDYKAYPTEQEYLQAKTVPTCSVTWRILWGVDVNWTITDAGNTRTETENLLYVTNGIRKYFSAIISGTTVTPIPEAQPEGSNA